MKGKVHENDYMVCWIEDGIVYAEYKPKILDYEGAKECVSLRLEVVGEDSYPTLINGMNVNNITKEARDYFGSDLGSKGVLASAIITSSTVGKFIANFFLNINRPQVPIRIFNDKNDAIKWLMQFSKHE